MKKSNNYTKWTFTVNLWDETGNVSLFRKDITVVRVCQFVAKEFLYRKYKHNEGYEIELNYSR